MRHRVSGIPDLNCLNPPTDETRRPIHIGSIVNPKRSTRNEDVYFAVIPLCQECVARDGAIAAIFRNRTIVYLQVGILPAYRLRRSTAQHPP